MAIEQEKTSEAPAPVLDEKNVAGSDVDAPSSTAEGLSEAEKSIIDKQLDAPNEKVGYFALFRYANGKDVAIMVVATIASIVAGACLPLMTVSTPPGPLIFIQKLMRLACVRKLCGKLHQLLRGCNCQGPLPEPNQSIHAVLCLSRHRLVHVRVHRHAWILVHGRANHAADPRALSESHLPTEHCLFRLSGLWRDHDPYQLRYVSYLVYENAAH